jgi:hypothetical protein
MDRRGDKGKGTEEMKAGISEEIEGSKEGEIEEEMVEGVDS